MNHPVLARKWRPKNFAQLVGQGHVVRVLHNAITQNRLHHAYLFTGTRGVGKTTIARIFAKCLNCELGVTATPCGECSNCKEIDSGRFLDLLEVDAASRTKVEDTRDLLDNVQYAPSKGRFKVYLIDEVHMLSGHSFNALLKTLEEPPAHVKFLLATTDPQKLPITVLSRCLQFHLKNLSPETIVTQMEFILSQEHITYELPGLQHIARAANGSMRDALSLLDQAIGFSNGTINTHDVQTMLGVIEQTYLYELLDGLHETNAEKILTIILRLAEQAVDFNHVLEEMISLLQRLATVQAAPQLSIDAWEDMDKLRRYAKQFSAENIQLYYQIGIISRRDQPLAPSPRGGFEMAMLRMLAFSPTSLTTAKTKPEISEVKNSATPPAGETQWGIIKGDNREVSPLSAKRELSSRVASHPERSSRLPTGAPENPAPPKAASDWQQLLTQLTLTGMTAQLAANCQLQSLTDTEATLLLHPSQAPLLNNNIQQRLQQALSDYLAKPITLSITVGDQTLQTPAVKKQLQQQQQLQQAQKIIENDPNVKAICETFDGRILPESIKAIEET